MKKITIKSLLLILAVVLASSCGPTLKVSSDYDRSADFSAYETFSIYNLETSRNVNQLNTERIVNSIKAEMTKKGFKETSNSPDLMVNAVTVLKNKKSFSATTNFYGYGGAYRPYGYWGRTGMATGYTTVQPHNYKDGSLMIDVVDAKTKRLVWQGTGNTEFDRQPKNPDEAISKAVAKIMAAFPGEATKK